jgi:hypothetical protein
MPEPVETANVYEARPEAAPQAIVVYCSAPRFQTAFDHFIEQELGLAKGEFIPFVIAGGAGVLAHPQRLPKEFKFMRDRFELLRRTYPSVQRIVLINHEDCAYYRMLGEKLHDVLPPHADGRSTWPREDMALIGDIFTRLLAHLGVPAELYYARFADEDHTKVAFERMTPRSLAGR